MSSEDLAMDPLDIFTAPFFAKSKVSMLHISSVPRVLYEANFLGIRKSCPTVIFRLKKLVYA